MSAKNYMPYIDGAMEHIQRIYDFNQKIDEMRMKSLGIQSIDDYYIFWEYSFNNGLRMYLEERGEYTTARLANDPLEAVDAIVDQFVVAIGEIRKCALSDDYEKIDFWETRAQTAYWDLDNYISNYTRDQFKESGKQLYSDELYNLCEERVQKSLTAVIDALFTRFWDDAYIDENGKFIKSKGYTKPDLSFLLWK